MKKQKKPFLFAMIYSLLLVGFTAYVMLDTFIIPQAESRNAGTADYSLFEGIEEKPLETAGDEKAKETAASSKTGSGSRSKQRSSKNGSANTATSAEEVPQESKSYESYSDDNISITLSEYYEYDTAIYVADVRLSSAKYLRTAFAGDTYGKNITDETSDTAENNSAILAVNGDYYGARENGYVIRNGVLYRDIESEDTDVLCIYPDGHFEITDSSEKSAQQLVDEDVWQAFTFGPGLLEEGEITVSEKDEVGRAMASNPRTALGMIDDLHYVFVVSDGRTSESAGLSLYQLAEFMKKLGVQTGYNLDGGGSSTLYYNGEVINNPTSNGKSFKERKVSDIVYIGH